MKLFTILVISFIALSCKQHKAGNLTTIKRKIDSTVIKEFNGKEIINDSNIVNSSGHKIIVLYNSTVNLFSQKDSIGFRFTTECMFCEPIQVYKDHLIFASQLEIFGNKTLFNNRELTIDTSAVFIKRFGSNGRDSKPNNFNFSSGTGQIKYESHSCNDAELNTLTLNYKPGCIRIKNLLNAEFFEYDIDKDGTPEQYILATRNCSQELAILKIQ